MRALVLAMVLMLAVPAYAEVIESSPRPLPPPRGTTVAGGETPVLAGEIITRSPRPLSRPDALSNSESVAAIVTDEGEADVALAEVAPLSRKEKRLRKRAADSMTGAVCGVSSIKGEEIAPIASNIDGCGVTDAVMVTSVGGVGLSQSVTVDCSVVKSLDTWVKDVAQPAFDGKLAELKIAAHYVCRSRNNKKGAKISEHGKGRAIDISAFILTDGKVLTVKDDYKKTLKKIYKAACGVFQTTLGPGSDGYHEDHFHFDTAIRSGGSYCR